MKRIFLSAITLFAIASCSSESEMPGGSTPVAPTESMYFPPISSGNTTWETRSISDLGWHANAVQPLLDYLEQKHSKSFIVLVNGRIVMENYFNGHTATSYWYWASAGKTLTSTITGIAQQEGLLNINNKVSDYLGNGWTSAPLAKENLINCKNLLTMTSGLDDNSNGDCVTPACLTYLADSGTRWAYDNVYVKLQDVVASVAQTSFSNYFNSRLRDKIGMNGIWTNTSDSLSVFSSNSRSMARFGLLILNKGKWDNQQILNESYWNEATNTSQNINLAYGYLWWLNGKTSYHLPQSQYQFSGSIIPSAPSDMYMALGKNDQKIYIIPSQKMVIIRMGDAADGSNMALSDFDEVLWQKIKALYE